MSLLDDAVEFVRAHFGTAEAEARTFSETHLPVLADAAAKVASNPLVAAALAAEHLGAVPDLVQGFADMVNRADAAVAAAHAQGAAEAQAAAEAARAAEAAGPEAPAA